MQRLNNTYTNRMNDMSRPSITRDMGDWGAEINGGGMPANERLPWPAGQDMSRSTTGTMVTGGMTTGSMMNNGDVMRGDELSESMQNHLDSDMVESPTTVEEAYRGSIKKLLSDNKGNFVVATFLIGTQGTVEFDGVLYEVGNDYVVIYQTGRGRYIVVDLYSLKYVEFYDTEKRRLCSELLQQQGMWPQNMWTQGES